MDPVEELDWLDEEDEEDMVWVELKQQQSGQWFWMWSKALQMYVEQV